MVAVGMFVFGVFAMPPLYDKFCEITGIGQAGVQVASAGSTPANRAGSERTVKLFFDATANSALPWDFEPAQLSMQVTLDEPTEASYVISSQNETMTAGQAVYNVTPPAAAPYFVKTECFCFSRQKLEAGERREMPVRFYIERGLPEKISEITLSYTFFLNEETGSDEALTQQAQPGIN
jgi:cytochrome c oxidase assembly protein subunit 11